MRFFAALLIAATLTAWSSTSTAQPNGAPAPTPAPVLRVIPLGPNGAPLVTVTAAPNQVLVRYAGQLLDVERGYVFFTTGDGFKLDPNAKVVDYTTKQPVTQLPGARMYADATFDKATGRVVELAVSKKVIKSEQDFDNKAVYEQIQKFAVSESALTPSTDKRPNAYNGPGNTGKAVAVTFVTQVPPSTPLTDSVYITTDVTNWDPRAILMTRIDALHYRVTTSFASGTIFHYKYTRGNFRTIEVGRDGLDDPPHTFTVRESDALRRDDVVYHWKDESLGSGLTNLGPGSVPTPFNPSGILNLPTPPPGLGPTYVHTPPPGFGPPNTGPGGTRGPAAQH